MKITIECNETQARVIQEACDLYSRLLMGQCDEIDNLMRKYHYNKDIPYETCECITNLFHQTYFPELHVQSPNCFCGIFCDQTPETSKISWDILQVIRNKVAWYDNPNGGMTVDFGDPIQTSKEPLCKVEIKEE